MPRKVRGKEVSKEGAMDEWKEKKEGSQGRKGRWTEEIQENKTRNEGMNEGRNE